MKYNFKNHIIRRSRDETVADREWMEDESMKNGRYLTKGCDPDWLYFKKGECRSEI